MAWPQPPALPTGHVPGRFPPASLDARSATCRSTSRRRSAWARPWPSWACCCPRSLAAKGSTRWASPRSPRCPSWPALLTLFAGRIGPRSPARLAILRAGRRSGPAARAGGATSAAHRASRRSASGSRSRWAHRCSSASGPRSIPRADRGRLLGLRGHRALRRRHPGPAGHHASRPPPTAGCPSSRRGRWHRRHQQPGRRPHGGAGRGVGPGASAPRARSARSWRTPMVRRIAAAQLLFGAGRHGRAGASSPWSTSTAWAWPSSDIALAGLLSYGSTAVTIGLWGRIAGRVGALVDHLGRHRARAPRPWPSSPSRPTFGTVMVATVAAGHQQCRGQCRLAAAHRRPRTRWRAGGRRRRPQLDHGPARPGRRPSC